MIDVDFKEGMPFFKDTILPKAENVLRTQLGSIFYQDRFGVDIERFIGSDLSIQMQTYKSCLVQQLAYNGINTLDLLQRDDTLETMLNFVIQEQIEEGIGA